MTLQELEAIKKKKAAKSENKQKDQTDKSDSTMNTPPSQVKIVSKPIPIDLELSNELTKDTNNRAGLSDAAQCSSPFEFASLFSTMISEKLVFSPDKREDLDVELQHYLPKLEWGSEDVIAATAGQALLTPASLLPDKIDEIEGGITPTVLMTMQSIAYHIALVRKQKLYLTMETTFDELDLFFSSMTYGYQRRNDTAALTNELTPSGGINSKMPTFPIPRFDGTPIDGDNWCADVVRKFKGNGYLMFINNRSYCDSNFS